MGTQDQIKATQREGRRSVFIGICVAVAIVLAIVGTIAGTDLLGSDTPAQPKIAVVAPSGQPGITYTAETFAEQIMGCSQRTLDKMSARDIATVVGEFRKHKVDYPTLQPGSAQSNGVAINQRYVFGSDATDVRVVLVLVNFDPIGCGFTAQQYSFILKRLAGEKYILPNNLNADQIVYLDTNNHPVTTRYNQKCFSAFFPRVFRYSDLHTRTTAQCTRKLEVTGD